MSIIITGIFSGLGGTIIGAFLTAQLTKRQHIIALKRKVAEDLFGYRYQLIEGDEKKEINAVLNKIPLIFHDNNKIVTTWNELVDGINPETNLVKLLKSVCQEIGINTTDWTDKDVSKVMLSK